MRILILFVSLALFTAIAAAQEKCKLNLNEAPKLHNVRLGMSAEEATRAFQNRIKVKAKSDGQSSFFKNFIKKRAKGNLAGIRAIFLRFYRGRIYQIELFYEEDHRWRDLESLLDDYSIQNNFPREFWQTKFEYASAKCMGFSLKADYKLNPHIQLTDDVAAKLVKNAREK
ncbi:MAG: hypothetical protein HKN25_10120 [Pyrinomonadaceae bacterium]|nr:hypothetical protein [Pyrinomonadaceae bacterium]